jgi:hypothetical protein
VAKYGNVWQDTDDNILRFIFSSRWTTEAEDTHSECLIFTAFPLQQMLCVWASALRYACTVSLSLLEQMPLSRLVLWFYWAPFWYFYTTCVCVCFEDWYFINRKNLLDQFKHEFDWIQLKIICRSRSALQPLCLINQYTFHPGCGLFLLTTSNSSF